MMYKKTAAIWQRLAEEKIPRKQKSNLSILLYVQIK